MSRLARLRGRIGLPRIPAVARPMGHLRQSTGPRDPCRDLRETPERDSHRASASPETSPILWALERTGAFPPLPCYHCASAATLSLLR